MSGKRRRGATAAVFSVTGVIIISKLLGFIKQMVTSAAFGANTATDMINIAQTVIGDLEYVLANVLMTSFISVYINAADEGEVRRARFAKNAAAALLIISAAAAVLIGLTSYPLAGLLAPGYDSAGRRTLARYIAIYTPLLILFALTAVNQGLLNADRRFTAVEARSIPQSIIIIAAIALLSGALGADSLVVGFLVYTAFNTVWFYLLARRYYHAPMALALHDEAAAYRSPFADLLVRRLLRLSMPLLVGYSAYYVNQQINKSLASRLGEGAVTELGYGAVLYNLVTAFIASFASIMFSYVTDAIAKGRGGRAARIANGTAAGLCALFLPVSIICVMLSRDISSIAFGRGEFTDKNVASTAAALAGYSVSFLPLIIREVYGRVSYGYGDTRRPMINSIISIACNITLSIIIAPRFGVGGITLAYSAATLVYGVLDLITARRHDRHLSLMPTLRLLPQMAAGGILCGAAVYFISASLDGRPVVWRFALSAAAGIAVYALPLLPNIITLLRRCLRGELFADAGDK